MDVLFNFDGAPLEGVQKGMPVFPGMDICFFCDLPEGAFKAGQLHIACDPGDRDLIKHFIKCVL